MFRNILIFLNIVLYLRNDINKYRHNKQIIASKYSNSVLIRQAKSQTNSIMKAKKTFRELYIEELNKPTAAQKFIRDVSELTHRSEVTVRFWLSGRQVPDELAQTIIAKKYNVDVKHLFPISDK